MELDRKGRPFIGENVTHGWVIYLVTSYQWRKADISSSI